MKQTSLQTRRLVCCAILAAMSVVFLWIGAASGVLDLTALMITGLCTAFAVMEIGVRWAWLIYAVTAALSFLIVPSKELAILYLLTGMYPIAKSAYERLHPLIAWILKLSTFNTTFLAYLFIAQKLLGLSGLGYDFAIGTLALGNVSFLLVDFALTVFISAYWLRIRRRLHLNLK